MCELTIGADSALARLERGDTVHMEFLEAERRWWFESPFEVVEPGVIEMIAFGDARKVSLIEAGDSLFHDMPGSQSWTARRV